MFFLPEKMQPAFERCQIQSVYIIKKHAHLKGIIQEFVSAVYCLHANMNVSVCPQFLNSKKLLFNIKLRKYIKIPLSKYMH